MNGIVYTKKEMAACIDHTLLKPDASKEDILRICSEAKQYGFASVCVNPAWISLAAQTLNTSAVKPCCVISFPLGCETPELKAMEAAYVIEQGALEVDMVINIGAVKSKNWDLAARDIRAVTAVKRNTLIKVIIEACLLTNEEKKRICQIAKENGADFIKTSTGFSIGGALPEDVVLMKEIAGKDMNVKASGGIRTLADAECMLEAGATRLGTSAGIEIISQLD